MNNQHEGNGDPMNISKSAANILEKVITSGDLSKLSPADRVMFYSKTCESLGLNPLTRPFEYIVLNGKLTLYARKDCTDQLRAIHGISVTDLTESERDGVFIVTAKVLNAVGRTDVAKGAVSLQGLKGDALANALMKAETKAKRRATLSICGLGVLDETELETIPASSVKELTYIREPGDEVPEDQPQESNPVSRRCEAMLKHFQEKYGVTQHQILAYLDKKDVAELGAQDVETMIDVNNAIKSGDTTAEETFAPLTHLKDKPTTFDELLAAEPETKKRGRRKAE